MTLDEIRHIERLIIIEQERGIEGIRGMCFRSLDNQCAELSNWELRSWKLPPCYAADEFVYCLVDPITFEVCYIGQTENLERRYKQHCAVKSGMLHQGNLPFSIWLSSLVNIGKRPEMLVLQCVDLYSETCGTHCQIETRTIKEMWSNGHPLLNRGLNGGARNRQKRLEWVDRLTNSKWSLQRGGLLESSGGYYPHIGWC